MRKAGIREARQHLSSLLAEVRKGREVVITDRGVAVARLVPPAAVPARPFPDRSAFRRRMPVLAPPLSETIGEDRDDRL
jgi:prevent-host-death family protein